MHRLQAVGLLVAALLSASCGAADCVGDATVCGGACVETRSDNLNCGACGYACPAGEVCSAGACALTCQAGLVNCGGKCVDPLTDRAFCGASGSCSGAQAGTACAAGEVCSAGACALTCQAGLVNCGGKCVDPLTDPVYCGAAADCTGGLACGSSAACYQGMCEPLCPVGFVLCSGACIDPTTDSNFCGASGYCTGASAGTTCSPAQTCIAGACTPTCTWETVAAHSLATAPTGSVLKNGAMLSQGPATVGGQTAWSQLSDWNMLFVPTGLTGADDVFKVEADVFVATPTTSALYANLMLFTTTDTAPGPQGTCQALGGLYPALASRSSAASTLEWWLSATCPYVMMTATPLAGAPTGQWRRFTVEGIRSSCRFRALLDGALLGTWTGTCSMSGGYFVLYAHAWDLGVSAQVAWSNMVIARGNHVVCVP